MLNSCPDKMVHETDAGTLKEMVRISDPFQKIGTLMASIHPKQFSTHKLYLLLCKESLALKAEVGKSELVLRKEKIMFIIFHNQWKEQNISSLCNVQTYSFRYFSQWTNDSSFNMLCKINTFLDFFKCRFNESSFLGTSTNMTLHLSPLICHKCAFEQSRSIVKWKWIHLN